MDKVEKISNVILVILGIVLSVDLFLELFFSIGTKQSTLIIGYFVSFMLLSKKFKSISKNKFVIIPFYTVVVLQIISFVLKFI